MLSAPKNLAVKPEVCLSLNCSTSCDNTECELCLPCAPIGAFHAAYREHQRRGEMLRIFPTGNYLQPKLMKQLSNLTQVSLKWFKAKCDVNSDYC